MVWFHQGSAVSTTTLDDGVKFERLRSWWLSELSRVGYGGPREMSLLKPYQRIIGMGKAALPFIFNELRNRPDHWFWALEAITERDDVIPEESRGNLRQMTEVWLRWAEENDF